MSDETNIFRRIEWAIDAARESATTNSARHRIDDVSVHSAGYAEPGYADPASGAIVCGNWNTISEWSAETRESTDIDTTPKRLAQVLEKLGAELEWSDEWSDCHECCKLVRNQPDSYSWKPAYNCDDGELLCFDCMDPEEYLVGLEGNCNGINQIFDPEEHDYVLVSNDFQRGMHRGQDSHPKLIGDLMSAAGFSRWIFHLESKGQFDIDFSLWLHREEAEQDDGDGIILAKRVIERGSTDGASVSEAMRRGLQEAGRQSDEMRKAGATGLLVSKFSEDGATTKEVSDKDFVEGKALD